MAIKAKEKTGKRAREPQSTGCLGPLADLEAHLPGEWWRHLFDSVYLKTDADVVENAENTAREVDLVIAATQPGSGDRILDLCCGQGRHTLELGLRGYPNITGVDRSRYLTRLARKRGVKAGLTSLQFREGDARKTRFSDNSFDVVIIMGNSFGYFEREEENRQVLHEVYRILKPGGRLFLDVTDGEWMQENFTQRTWEWVDQEMLVCRQRHLSADRARLITREVVIDVNKGVMKDQFYAERLYRRQELLDILTQAGFPMIQQHENIQALSTRTEEDLGMMANRFMITAKIGEKPVAVAKRAERKRLDKLQCTVLLGDPRLPDVIKRDGQFNAEDFETIQRLRSGLEPLKAFNFAYLDDHAKLINSLVHHRPHLVLNLCDEGYRNDAFLELHVPALLEMLNIPYTGAGPACLGLCYNKGLVRAWAKEMDIPTPEEIWLERGSSSAAIPSEFPALVKPAYGDSSIGITQQAVTHSPDELLAYCDELRSSLPDVPLLIQEFLQGAEYSVGIIGNNTDFTLLPILEVDYSGLPKSLPPILGYESKWLPDSPYWNSIRYQPATLSEETARELYDSSILLFNRLGCRDYARFDFRADANGVIKFLEVNPNPGWCWDGKLNLMASFMGWDYPTLLEQILTAARTRLNL